MSFAYNNLSEKIMEEGEEEESESESEEIKW